MLKGHKKYNALWRTVNDFYDKTASNYLHCVHGRERREILLIFDVARSMTELEVDLCQQCTI